MKKNKQAELVTERRPCWIIWAILSSGHQVIKAICLSEPVAEAYTKYVTKLPKVERVLAEKSLTDHLYFGLMEKGPIMDPASVKKALAKAREAYRSKPAAKPTGAEGE